MLVFLSQLPSTIDCTNTIPEYMKDFGLTQLGVIGLVISNQLRVPSLDTKVHTRSLRCTMTDSSALRIDLLEEVSDEGWKRWHLSFHKWLFGHLHST